MRADEEKLMLSTRNTVLAAVVGIALIAGGGYAVARFNGQQAIQSADFRNAATAEIRDSRGAVVLQGTFMLVEEEDDDIERKAALARPTGGGDIGEAEVEFATEMPTDQEVEFAARELTAGVTYQLVVDGSQVASVVADARGRIAVELKVPLPGALSSK
jgi:hypothetical protein